MKNRIALTSFVALVVGLFTGCAVTRPIADVAAGAGGAYLGNQLSHGDPVATAAGAAGGVVFSETLHDAAKTQSDKAFAAGYDKGKSDAVKQQYWLYVDAQPLCYDTYDRLRQRPLACRLRCAGRTCGIRASWKSPRSTRPRNARTLVV